MYCKNCGKEIDDNAAICIYCGVPTNPEQSTETKSNPLAIIGFIFTFIQPIVGLICSIIGYNLASKLNDKGKALSIAGIILSSCYLAIIFLFVFLSILGVSIFS